MPREIVGQGAFRKPERAVGAHGTPAGGSRPRAGAKLPPAPPTGPVTGGSGNTHVQIGTYLPLAHLYILEEEAKAHGVRRGQFLEMLLRRKLGLIDVRRSPHGRSYEFSDEELKQSEKFVWYMSLETRILFDNDRLQIGDVAVQAWIVFELNRWIGRPLGLRMPPSAEDAEE